MYIIAILIKMSTNNSEVNGSWINLAVLLCFSARRLKNPWLRAFRGGLGGKGLKTIAENLPTNTSSQWLSFVLEQAEKVYITTQKSTLRLQIPQYK